MKKTSLFIAFLLTSLLQVYAQNSDFYGNAIDKSICPVQGSKEDEEAIACMNKICNVADIPNNFAMVPCTGAGSCFATYRDGISYIVYDGAFFNRVKTFGFTDKKLPGAIDWTALTILAHEVGHHLCQHLTNTIVSSKLTPVQMELQADEYAGIILFKLGATLQQAQKAMYSKEVDEKGSASHPPRKDRLEAIAKGYNKYAKSGTPQAGGTASPVNNNNDSPLTIEGKKTVIIPRFDVFAEGITWQNSEQFKQIFVNSLQSKGTFNVIASSYDLQNVKKDPAVAYGGNEAIKKANYILVGKVMSCVVKDANFGLAVNGMGQKKAELTISFELINAKTNEILLTKECLIKSKTGLINKNDRQGAMAAALASLRDEAGKSIGESVSFFSKKMEL